MDFESFSTDDLADKTFQAFGFYISTIKYLEKESPLFTNVIDLELTVKPAMVHNSGQVVTGFKEKMVKKKNKPSAKRKERLVKFCVLIRSSLFSRLKSSSFLSFCSVPFFVPTLVITLVSCLEFFAVSSSFYMPALSSRSRSPAVLLSYCVPALVSHFRYPAILLSCYIPAPAASVAFSFPHYAFISCHKILTLLFPLLPLSPPLLFRSSIFRTFK